MNPSERQRQFLSDRRHEHVDEEDQDVAVRPRREPAKVTAAEVADAPGLLAGISPGKVTREDLSPGGAMPPGTALQYSEAIARAPRIDRRAEPDAALLD